MTDVNPVPVGDERTRDLFDTAIAITFEDENGNSFYRGVGRDPSLGVDNEEINASSSIINRLRVVITRPVAGCLSKKRIRQGTNNTGLISIFAPLPDDLELSISPVEEMAVARYRQALALDLMTAHIVTDTARIVPIPADFWRSDAALRFLTEKGVTSIELDGTRVRGHIFADLQKLRSEWRKAFGQLPASGFMAGAEFWGGEIPPPPLRTPGIVFLERIAHELDYLNGTPGRWSLTVDQIAAWIEHRWDDAELGTYKRGMATACARLVALPEHLAAGAPNAEKAAQRQDWQNHYHRETMREYRALENR